jgi:NADH-quinone oxidoreductase subunit C
MSSLTNEELKNVLLNFQPALAFEESGEWLTGSVAPAQWLPLANFLRKDPACAFDFLFCVTGVDWKTHLAMVYHFRSTVNGQIVVINVNLDRANPEIESVTGIWKTADFHEREAAELFGINFLHHPDLRKLILPDDWTGYPLRKDYEDPVNMIRL